MTTIAKILISILLALFISSCSFNTGSGVGGNGIVTKDTRNTPEKFTIISTTEGLNVYITQANVTSIHVEADENIIDFIKTDIKNGKLSIHTSENIGFATKKIHVTLPLITELKSSSGANVIVKNVIETNKIALNASSGSNIKLEITAHEIKAKSSSGANIRISGNTNNLFTNASSGSNIKAKKLITKTCNAAASSGSGISLNVSEDLRANAYSGGAISYTGNADVEKNKSVSGSITKS
mgnify:CR=1 FL=1